MPTDLLTLSAYLHAREPMLLTAARRERMLAAPSFADALKVLAECGYDVPAEPSLAALEQMLAAARAALYGELRAMAPDDPALAVFSAKYDYHNAKVLLKASVTGEEADRLLMEGGRYELPLLKECFLSGDYRMLSPLFAEGITRAQEELASLGDAQRADVALDRAYFLELTQLSAGEPFLAGYVALLIDAANLRTAVRLRRMSGGEERLADALFDGGNVLAQRLLDARGAYAELYQGSELAEAGALGEKLDGGSLTRFERACDDAVGAYYDAAARAFSGEAVVAYYLCARESEWTAIRTILSGRAAGLSGDAIRARLREVV